MQTYMKGKANAEMVAGLNRLLADTFVLYFKTHAAHWNVEGQNFGELHEFFGEQYKELWGAVDEIAERMRALGAYAPTSLAQLTTVAKIAETKKPQKATDILKDLAAAHTDLIDTLGTLIELADTLDDDATEDMMIGRLQAHEKMAWMLKAHLK